MQITGLPPDNVTISTRHTEQGSISPKKISDNASPNRTRLIRLRRGIFFKGTGTGNTTLATSRCACMRVRTASANRATWSKAAEPPLPSPPRRAALAANPPRPLGNRTHPHILEPLGPKEPLAAQVVHGCGPVLVPVVVGHVFAAVGAPLKHKKSVHRRSSSTYIGVIEGKLGFLIVLFIFFDIYRHFFFFPLQNFCHLLSLCVSRFRFTSLGRGTGHKLSPPTRPTSPPTHPRPAAKKLRTERLTRLQRRPPLGGRVAWNGARGKASSEHG